MFIYNVTVNIDDDVHDEWLNWMRTVHIPEVMQTGLFLKHKIIRVLVEEEMGGKTYSIQYYFEDMNDYDAYQKEHAQRLQASHAKRYKDKFVAFRTILKEIE